MVNPFFHEQLQFTRSFKKKLNEKLAEAGLFHSQWLVLYTINKQQSVTHVEISDYLDVEKPTVSRTVKRLEEQDLVETIPSEDKREKRLQLTEKGLERYKEGHEIVTHFEKELSMDISEADAENTLSTIKKLNEKLNEGGI